MYHIPVMSDTILCDTLLVSAARAGRRQALCGRPAPAGAGRGPVLPADGGPGLSPLPLLGELVAKLTSRGLRGACVCRCLAAPSLNFSVAGMRAGHRLDSPLSASVMRHEPHAVAAPAGAPGRACRASMRLELCAKAGRMQPRVGLG